MTTSPDTQRDELARTLMDASAYAWEKDGSRHWPNMADTLLAAGYRKPRTITTVEELDALPDGSIVMADWATHQLVLGRWATFGSPDTTQPALPATVLWEPEA